MHDFLNVKSEENKDDNIIGKIKYQVCDEFLNFIDEINNNSKQARKLIECNILNFNDKKYDGEYSKYNDNDVKFDYRLKEGPATTRNAIKLLGVLGYDEQIVTRAQKMADGFMESGSWEKSL